jgi:hypothetical protein
MGAITQAPTPPKSREGKGFYVDFLAQLDAVISGFTDNTSNGTTGNTIAELRTYIVAQIAALTA